MEVVYLRRDSSETKRKILTVCVRLFLEQGYKNTSVSQVVDEAGVARGSYLNLFPNVWRSALCRLRRLAEGRRFDTEILTATRKQIFLRYVRCRRKNQADN